MFDLDKYGPAFDGHIHAPGDGGENLEWVPGTIPDMPALVRFLDKVGVAGGVLMSIKSILSKDAAGCAEGNRQVARMMDRWPGRFAGAINVSPVWLDEALVEMHDCREQLGFAFLGECVGYLSGYSYDTPQFDAILAEAEKLDLVVNIHCDPAEMDRMAAAHPKLTFILPHFGDKAGFTPLLDMLERRPNVCFDICGSQYVRLGFVEGMVKRIGARRMIFGSDLPICDPATVIARVLSADITDDDKRQILGKTLLDLLAQRGVKLKI